VKKREAEAKASARPSFVSKKDREAAALKRREEEVAARRNRGSNDTRAPPGVGSGSFPFRETYHDRAFDRRRGGDAFDDARARERELELIRAQYMGGAKAKKKVTKPSDKFKFKFDWDKDQDTSADLNPLYDRPHESALAFGRGARAGVDRRVVAEEGARRQMALVAQSRRDAGAGRVTDEEASLMRRGSRVASEREARAFADAKRRHWSEKSAAEMTERDWRIFREDHNITTRGGRLPTPMRSWSEAGMPPEILRAIRKVGYDTPSPIQMASIPIGLLKRDVIGIAETGSGKTCAFVVPMLAYIAELPRMTDEVATRGPYALVMAPTRELVAADRGGDGKVRPPGATASPRWWAASRIEEQSFKRARGVEVSSARPAASSTCSSAGTLVLNQCNYVVLDEADRMIDMGFEPQVKPCSTRCLVQPQAREEESLIDPRRSRTYRQTYMFSATMPPQVERIARTYLRNPAVVYIGDQSSRGTTSSRSSRCSKRMPKNDRRASWSRR
jgi:ATP-dependent RNA helicase DDX23/PRP28